MELCHALLARMRQILLGVFSSGVLYAGLHLLLEEYVALLAGGGSALCGYLLVSRGSSGPLDSAGIEDAFAWGFGALLGTVTMHTLAQGAVI